MNKEEKLAIKLNMIYEELFNLRWIIEKQEMKKRKENIEDKIKKLQSELEEIHFQENDYWNVKERKMREFNLFYGEKEEVK